MPAPTSPTARLLAPVAVRALITDLIEHAEQSLDIAIDPMFDLNPTIPQRILAGERFDVGITNPWYVQDLVDGGKVDVASHRPFGRTPLAIAGPVGVSRPLATTAEDIRELLLSCGSIAYTADGTSGKTLLRMLQGFGVLDAVADRLVPMGPGRASVSPVGSLAAGEVDLAIAPLTTIVAAPAVAHVATFTGGQKTGAQETDIDMSVFVSAAPDDSAAAQALARFLSDPALDARLAAKGLTRFSFDA